MTVIEQIDAIWVRFREQIAEAYKAAYEVDEPAGNSPAWQALWARWGVEHISDTERAQVIAAQKPLRGAPAMELVAVVQVSFWPIEILLNPVWPALSSRLPWYLQFHWYCDHPDRRAEKWLSMYHR